MSETPRQPVLDPEFWRGRVEKMRSRKDDPYIAVYDIDSRTWKAINNHTRVILARHLQPGDRILDAGCGVGTLCTLLPDGVVYAGIDLSPDFVEVARGQYPMREFFVGTFEGLAASGRRFDWVVCRAVRGMVITECGQEVWDQFRGQLLSVCDRMLLFDYGNLPYHEVLTPDGRVEPFEVQSKGG